MSISTAVHSAIALKEYTPSDTTNSVMTQLVNSVVDTNEDTYKNSIDDNDVIKVREVSALTETEQLHDHQAEVKTIAGLCICCSTGNELVDALTLLSTSSDPVVIEATGVANSLQLVEKLVVADLLEVYTLAQAIFVLDAAEANATGFTAYTDELKAADIVLLTKPDLVTADEQEKLVALLQKAGAERVYSVLNGALDEITLTDTSNILSFFAEHSGEFSAHDDNTNYTIIDMSKTLIEGSELEMAWPLLVERYGLRRMKGDVLTHDGDIVHVEATPRQLRITKGDDGATKQLVVIGNAARTVTREVLLEATRGV